MIGKIKGFWSKENEWKNFFWQNEETSLQATENRTKFFKEIEKLGISQEIISGQIKELRKMEEKIKRSRGKNFPPVKIIMIQRDLVGKERTKTVKEVIEEIEELNQKESEEIFSFFLEYLKEESIFSSENFSRGELEDDGKPKIYINLKEFAASKKFREEKILPIYTLIFNSFFLSSEFFGDFVELAEIEESLISDFELDLKKEDQRKFYQGLTETFEIDALKLAAFIFSQNFLEDEQLAEIIKEAIKIEREQTKYVFQLLQTFPKTLQKIEDKKTREELGQRLTNFLVGWIINSIIDWALFLKQAEAIGQESLQKKIRKEINKMGSKRDLGEFKELFRIFELHFTKIVEKAKRKFLSVSLEEYFPPEVPEIPVERLEKILKEKGSEDLAKKVEIEGLSTELLKEIQERTIISEEDMRQFLKARKS